MSNELWGVLFTFLPFIVIIMLANVAQGRREADQSRSDSAIFSYLLLIAFYLLTFLGGVLIQLSGILSERRPELLENVFPAELGINPLLEIDSLTTLGVGFWLPSLIGILLLLPPFRRLAARIIPIDAQSPVHAVALSYIMLVIINLMLTLGVGLDNLTTLLAESNAAEEDLISSLSTLWGQQIIMAILAAIGVGWLTRRSWSATLARLGLRSLTPHHLLTGIGIGIGMVPVVVLLSAVGSTLDFGMDPDVEALTEQLLGPLFNSLWGVATLGLAAALGEETLFRGALQPRFGLWATALIFALVHSNYGISLSTVVVFILGIVLGIVRNRYSTATAMVVHAAYNISLGLMAYLSIPFLDNV